MKADSLKEALRTFISPDYLKGTDRYKCEKCVLMELWNKLH
jgi:ubiquitin carboxyl-terminal hydrolase 36/42